MQESFYDAAEHGLLQELLLLMSHGAGDGDGFSIDVNLKKGGFYNYTALHFASENGHVDIVRELLKVPGIDPNSDDSFLRSPLILACQRAQTEVIQVLLSDPRVEANKRENWNKTALWWASNNNHPIVVKWLIVSGREIGLVAELNALRDTWDSTPMDVATKRGHSEIVTLLTHYQQDPKGTRFKCELELGLVEHHVANLFASIVFLCDEYLEMPITEEKDGDDDKQ